MTINSETRVAGPFDGNDSTVSFPFTFKVFDSDEVRVVAETGAVETDLELGTDYTVTLNADQNASPGGSVVLVDPLATGARLTLTSALEMLQPVDLTNQGGFYPRVINSALDRLTILLQQLASVVSRTLKFPLSDGPVGDLPGRSVRAGTVLAFDEATGEPVAGPDISSVNGVAGALVAINTVAVNIADVNTVATNIADVNTVGQNLADVNTVVDNIADVNTVADNIADVNTVADNITDLSNFSGVYYGPSATEPTTRRDGSPLQVGDLYFSTITNAMRTYNGSAWRESVSGAVTVQNFSGNSVETEFLLDYAPESEVITNVFIGGVYRQKNTYELGGANGDVLIFSEAPPAGTNNIEVVVSSLIPSDDKLRQELANGGQQLVDSAVVGYGSQTVYDRLSQYVSVKDFGAVGDGTADDTIAIKAAIDATTGVLFFPAGSYRVTSTISWNKNDLWIVGAGEGASKIIADFAAGDILCIGDGVANPNNSGISHITIGSFVAKTSGAAIRLRNGHNLKVSRIRMDNNLFFGVQLDGGPQQFLYYLDNFEISGAVSAGIVVGEDGTLPQDLWISTGIVVNCQNGILLKHGSGVYLSEMDLVDCDSGITTYPAAGQNVLALWANTVIADTCKSSGWKVITDGGLVAEWTLTACWGASCGVNDGGHGMVFNPGPGEIKAISITGPRCINNQGNGIYIQGGEDFSIVNPQCLGNSQGTPGAKYGIEIFSGVSQFNISGGVCGQGGLFSTNPQGYGIVVDPGASDNYVISGVNVLGNVSGGISDGGTGLNKHIVNNIGYKTAASGSVTIPAGQTSVAVSHGLASPPLHKDITLTRGTSSAGSVDLYVDSASIGASQFTIRTAPAPSSDIVINWVARTQGA